MTNEEVMQLMTDMELHEGGIENWVMDNAWVLVVNKAIEKEREAILQMFEAFAKLVAEKEREACARLCDVLAVHPEYASEVTKLAAQAIRNRGQS